MVNTRTVNDDGLEMNFATNTLGMYILTNGLLDSITDRWDSFFSQKIQNFDIFWSWRFLETFFDTVELKYEETH